MSAPQDESRKTNFVDIIPPPMDLVSEHVTYSIKPDMMFGWRPDDITGAPIPMHFDYE
jgi:hypothetical protein